MFVIKKSYCSYKIIRHLHSTNAKIRVRFAPSPTGYLHLGGLRTALYNYLFSKHHKGKFLLRIEDTDQTRLIPDARQRLIEDLLWTGIEIDEGPGFGGTHGPYVQSERLKTYNDAVLQLIENGSAYHCFCTERRIELLRKEALRTRQIPRYDNKCRDLPKDKVEALKSQGTPYCIRFKLTQHTDPFNDLIYGKVQHDVSATEGDPVIIKSDKYPTYHFANVVDDHFMGITHVLRGVEWQISTTKHILLYNAFGWQPPAFGHLPLLINSDGTKLSKRQGDIGIQHFRNRGYFPEAILNYVVSAGGGFEHHPNEKPKFLDMHQLVENFQIEKVNSHPSRLNAELLNDYNRMTMKNKLEDESTQQTLVEQVQALVKQAYPQQKNLDLTNGHVLAVLQWADNRINLLQDLTSKQYSFLWVKSTSYVLKDLTATQLEAIIEILQGLKHFNKDKINETLRSYANEQQLKFALIMKSLRSALSGLKEGPGVAEMMELLGKQVTVERLQEIAHSNSKNLKEISSI